jgi:hypothetical protein
MTSDSNGRPLNRRQADHESVVCVKFCKNDPVNGWALAWGYGAAFTPGVPTVLGP